MSGITPYLSIQKIAARLDGMDSKAAVNDALDEVEYLFEVIPTEMQAPVEELIARLRLKLKEFSEN